MMKPARRLSAVVLVGIVFLASCVVSRMVLHHRGPAASGRARGSQNCTTMVVPTDQRPGFRHAVTVGEPCPVAMSGAVAAI